MSQASFVARAGDRDQDKTHLYKFVQDVDGNGGGHQNSNKVSPNVKPGAERQKRELWNHCACVDEGTRKPREGCSRVLVYPPPAHPGEQTEMEPGDKRFCANRSEDVTLGVPPVSTLSSEWFPVRAVFDDMDRGSAPAKSDLIFESRFEGGNLWKAVRTLENEYNLMMRPDLNSGGCQWFYFLVRNMRHGVVYTFNLTNFFKDQSLYSCGMRPLMWSEKQYECKNIGWTRVGDNISYYENGTKRKNGSNYFTLSFQTVFPHDDDCCFLAMCYPYTYTDLQIFLRQLEQQEDRARTFTRTELCRTIGDNSCDLLTITSPLLSTDSSYPDKRKAIVISGRVHPGESNASFVVKGIVDFLTGSSHQAQLLREKLVFYVVPMLNPDGVINGFYRVSLSGHDLNRQWTEPSKHLHPTVFSLKQLLEKLAQDDRLHMYIDVHGHSTKRNVFMYGCCGASELSGRVQTFPRMLDERCRAFSFKDSKFDLDKYKETTGRAVVYKQLGVIYSYTIEASFCGYEHPEAGLVHFTTADLEGIGVQLVKTIAEFVAIPEGALPTNGELLSSQVEATVKADSAGPGAAVLHHYYDNLRNIQEKQKDEGGGAKLLGTPTNLFSSSFKRAPVTVNDALHVEGRGSDTEGEDKASRCDDDDKSRGTVDKVPINEQKPPPPPHDGSRLHLSTSMRRTMNRATVQTTRITLQEQHVDSRSNVLQSHISVQDPLFCSSPRTFENMLSGHRRSGFPDRASSSFSRVRSPYVQTPLMNAAGESSDTTKVSAAWRNKVRSASERRLLLSVKAKTKDLVEDADVSLSRNSSDLSPDALMDIAANLLKRKDSTGWDKDSGTPESPLVGSESPGGLQRSQSDDSIHVTPTRKPLLAGASRSQHNSPRTQTLHSSLALARHDSPQVAALSVLGETQRERRAASKAQEQLQLHQHHESYTLRQGGASAQALYKRHGGYRGMAARRNVSGHCSPAVSVGADDGTAKTSARLVERTYTDLIARPRGQGFSDMVEMARQRIRVKAGLNDVNDATHMHMGAVADLPWRKALQRVM